VAAEHVTLARLSFVPSKVDGLADVSTVTIYPDRIELQTAAELHAVHFASIARRQESLVSSIAKRCFFRRPYPKMVADRDWFHAPPNRFFTFYTNPSITVFMPADEVRDYGTSCFVRIQEVIRSGGFATFDLG
jgi:hypothetical protein